MVRCPKCKSKQTRVYSMKHKEDGTDVRYRKCLACGHRFKGVEVWEPDPEVDK